MTTSSDLFNEIRQPHSDTDSDIRQAVSINQYRKWLTPLTDRARQDRCAVKRGNAPPVWADKGTALDATRINEHIAGVTGCGVGFITPGQSTTRIALLDLDDHKGDTSPDVMVATASDLCVRLSAIGLRPTAFKSSGGRGLHLWLLWDSPQDAHSVRHALQSVLHAAGICEGTGGVSAGQVEIFPKQSSVEIGSDGNLAMLPLWNKSVPMVDDFGMGFLLEAPRADVLGMIWPMSDDVPFIPSAPRATVALGSAAPDDIERVRRALWAIPNGADGPDYNEWFKLMCATREATGGSDAGFEVFAAWTAQHPGNKTPLQRSKWDQKDNGGSGRGTLYMMATSYTPDWDAPTPDGFGDVVADTPTGGTLAPTGRRTLLPAFTRITSTGKIEAEINNLIAALARPDICGFHVRYDTFRDGIMLAPVGALDEWRSIKDSDNVNMRGRLQKGGAGFQPISKDIFRDVIHSVAEANPFDSAQHWLNGLVWDGVPRVNSFVPTCFGAKDTPYTQAVGLYMWTAMVGRVMVPGIKADMVPVLIGAQGARKSSAVAALVPSSDFFAAIDLAAPDADLARVMRSKLVIELDELKGLGTRESESIKSFITRPIDEWTPKYIEYVTRYPRRSVFFGTSNRDDILADDTGNRRWLPFRVGMCDVDGIARDRDQLWAEARGLFASNGIMFAAAEQLAVAEHAEFAVHDEWDSSIAKWLQEPGFNAPAPCNRGFLRGAEIMADALDLSKDKQTPVASARVKRAMIRLGFQAVNRRVNGQLLRVFSLP